MDKGWLPFHPSPSSPAYSAPAGAVDAHCHVFGPGARFPFVPERKYTPCDASREQLVALRDHLGLSRNVIVQATCHGADNRALVDALDHLGDAARGVATVRADVTDAELERLHESGVRGIRFNFVKRLVDVLPTDSLDALASRVAHLGWHVVLYFEAPDLESLTPMIERTPCPVVIDHMGRPDVSRDPEGEAFERFQSLLRGNDHVYTKVSCPERLTKQCPQNGTLPGYEDVLPFSRALVSAFPDRVLWGTDWPHPNMKSHMPDDGALVDIIPLIATDSLAQRKLLIDNPERLYWAT